MNTVQFGYIPSEHVRIVHAKKHQSIPLNDKPRFGQGPMQLPAKRHYLALVTDDILKPDTLDTFKTVTTKDLNQTFIERLLTKAHNLNTEMKDYFLHTSRIGPHRDLNHAHQLDRVA